MSENLHNLHKLTAEAEIARLKYLGGAIPLDDFKKIISDMELHNHTNIVCEDKHKELDCSYREVINGILRLHDASKE